MASRRDFLKGVAICGASLGTVPLFGEMQTSGDKRLEIIRLSSRRQLFIDSYLIEEQKEVHQELHEAKKYGLNPVMHADQPWEQSVMINSGGPAVIYDPKVGLFKMLYFAYVTAYDKVKSLKELYIPCYATSTDGIRWEKPNLGLVEYAGSTQNNILPWPSQIPGGSTNVIYDLNDPNPARRYKSVYYSSRPHMRLDAGPEVTLSWDLWGPHSVAGLFVSSSADEIHWDNFPGNPVLSSRIVGDTHSLLGWDERVHKYVGFFRPAFEGTGHSPTVRVIGRSESSDFISWTDPNKQIVLSPDTQDPKGTEFYCMAAMFYQDYYVGLLWIYHNDPHWPWPKGTTITDDELNRHQQTMDTQLVTSRDGIHWERTANRETLISLGSLGSWDEAMINASTPLVIGDEIWVYYGGANVRHTSESLGNVGKLVAGRRKTMGIGLAKWRLDGFVSIASGDSDGTLLTKPMSLAGDQLWLNVDASKGWVAVEVLNENLLPVLGFTRADSIALKSDEVRQRVTWGANSSSLGSLVGKPIRLKFYLRNANLYSFWTT